MGQNWLYPFVRNILRFSALCTEWDLEDDIKMSRSIQKFFFKKTIFFSLYKFSCLITLALARSSTRPLRQSQWASLMQRLRRETVDLHSGEFCVDVSTFGPVLYDATPREKCTTVFNKQCEDKTEQVRILISGWTYTYGSSVILIR